MKSVGVLPQVRLLIDGEAIDAKTAAALANVRVQQRLSLPSLCELTFSLRTEKIEGLPRVGAHLELRVEENELLFTGDVTALEYSSRANTGRVLRVRAYDALHRLRKSQPVKAHAQFTAADLARELAGPLDLEVDAADEGRTIARWVQHRQNDLDFLAEVCARSGLYFFVDGGTLFLTKLEETDGAVALELGDTLIEGRIDISAETLCKSVAIRGWNPQRAAAHEASIDREETPDDLGDAVDVERTLTDELLTDDAEAEAIAHAELARRDHALVHVWGIAEGNVALVPGATVNITGIADEPRNAVITAVDHTIARTTGFRSEFSNPTPHIRTRDRAAVTALGIVTSVEDPDNLGRVKLSLPTYGDVETEWLPVVTAGAGAAKGFVAIPDVDDSVIVVFPRGEPGLGFVIGSLFRDAHPDPGIDGGRVKRYSFLTPNGQKLQLDDTRDSIRIENKQGSFIEMLPDKMTVHAATHLDVEAPGSTVTIRGKLINFERA
ncbi:MAG TPA: phage baseplate assembly protein V [Thermoanaerobaculia bacterium]|jgi:phage baseplate assembly protein gpV/phage protein D|nr:phage baseplate assembly protein V [Thermoanaerobaculia bacterium]